MFNLIIDTSTERGVVAISNCLHLAFTKELPFGLLNSRYLLSAINIGFQTLNIKSSDLKCVSVSIGPGSFTGIRVGVSAAKGIALGRGIPLIGFHSLEGFISLNEGPFISLIDARMNSAYIQHRERVEGAILPRSGIELVPLSTLPEAHFVGPLFERLSLKNVYECYPNLTHLARVSEEKFLAGEGSKIGYLPLAYFRNLYI